MKNLNFGKMGVAANSSTASTTQPELKPIQKKDTPESSQVKGIEYDPNKKQLTVHFKNGSYDYTPVSQDTASQAWAALSIGKFVNSDLKNKYVCNKR